MTAPKGFITKIAEHLEPDMLSKLSDWIRGLFGSRNHGDYPYEEISKQKWGLEQGIYLPIEKDLYFTAKERFDKNPDTALVVTKIVIAVEKIQLNRLLKHFDGKYQRIDNRTFVGQNLNQIFYDYVFSQYAYYQDKNLKIAPDVKIFIEEQISEPIGSLIENMDIFVQAKVFVEDAHTGKTHSGGFGQTYPPEINDHSPISITIRIHDADGVRQKEITQFPVILGRDCVEPNINIQGTYTSRQHLELICYPDPERPIGTLLFEFKVALLSSTNSIYVNGKEISPTSSSQFMNLGEKDVLRLSGNEPQNYVDYPQIEIIKFRQNTTPTSWSNTSITPTAPKVTGTPTAPPANSGIKVPKTPEVPSNMAVDSPNHMGLTIPNTPMPPAFKIAYHTYQGDKVVGISELPLLIGRGQQKPSHVRTLISIPSVMENPTNKLVNTVSGEHLLVEDVDDHYLYLTCLGKWGCLFDGKKIGVGEKFKLPFDASLMLGNDDEPVSIKAFIDSDCTLYR